MSVADEETWDFLYGFNGDALWQTALQSDMDRVRVLYNALIKKKGSSAYLDQIFGDTVGVQFSKVQWDVQAGAMQPAPVTVPVELAGFRAPTKTLPLLKSEKRVNRNKRVTLHNENIKRVRQLRLKRYGNPLILKEVVRPCLLSREIQLICDSFSSDTGITIANQKIPLTCPYTSARIGIPMRGGNCLHLETFDLNSWAAQVIKPNCPPHYWKCPICDETVYLGTAYISPYVMHILQTLPPTAVAAEIDKEARFTEAEATQRVASRKQNKSRGKEDAAKQQEEPEVIELSD